MFIDICSSIQQDLQQYKNSKVQLEDYVALRLDKSLEQYAKELDDSVKSLGVKNNINVLYRYSEV